MYTSVYLIQFYELIILYKVLSTEFESRITAIIHIYILCTYIYKSIGKHMAIHI